jgi:hypothetical protein
MTDKKPAELDNIIRIVYAVKDATARGSFIEALRHCGDAQARAQNELDWCLGTDRDLPSILGFLEQLSNCLSIAIQSTPACRAELQATIIEELTVYLTTVPKLVSGMTAHEMPDVHVDDIEATHRRRKYANIAPNE